MGRDYNPADILIYNNPSEMIKAFPEPLVHYENDGVILLNDCGFDFDESYIATITFPPEWRKIGTVDQITATPIIFRDRAFLRTHNPLCQAIDDDRLLLKLYSEFLRIELSFKLLISEVLPAYRNIQWKNCTFRFVKTPEEDVHLDVFNNGKPFPAESKLPRLKLFLNVDSEARIWNIGPKLRDVIRFSKDFLGSTLPSDLNVLCALINKSGAMDVCPKVKLEIPPRGIVFANGSTVVHQVVYGNRVIGLEGLMPSASLYSSAGSEWDKLRHWIREAGYSSIDDDQRVCG
jgi:hypothetical protein